MVVLLFCLLLCLVPVRVWAAGSNLLIADATSQVVQNTRANTYHLSRMRNVAMLRQFVHQGYLVHVPSRTRTYYLHAISSTYHYCRPWTRLFLIRLSRLYYVRFHRPLRVTSLVRTASSQEKLSRWNGNAAEAYGPVRSSHLTGATLDISKHSMSAQGQEWIRKTLWSLRKQGLVYAIEEFQQPTFHIMVYPGYARWVHRLEQ